MTTSSVLAEVVVGNMSVYWYGTRIAFGNRAGFEAVTVPSGGISRLDLESHLRARVFSTRSGAALKEAVEDFMAAVEELHKQEVAADRNGIFSDVEDSLGRWTRIK